MVMISTLVGMDISVEEIKPTLVLLLSHPLESHHQPTASKHLVVHRVRTRLRTTNLRSHFPTRTPISMFNHITCSITHLLSL